MKMLWLLRCNTVNLLSYSVAPIPFVYTWCLEVLENVNPDLSDSEFIEHEQPIDAPTPGFGESEIGDAPTPGPGAEGDGDEGDEEEGEGDIDEELAAELDLALGDEEGGGDEADEDDEEDDDDESEEEDDDDDDEATQTKKLLNEEIRDLEAAVAKKGKEVSSSSNPLIRVRQNLFYASRASTNPRPDTAETFRRCIEEAAGRPRHETCPARRIEGETTAHQRRSRTGGCRHGRCW